MSRGIPIRDGSNKTFVVLGMHRSGTSIVAKALHKVGIIMGKFTSKIPNFYEDTDFSLLNDKVLSDAGGGWDDIPDEKELKKSMKKHSSDAKNLVRSKKKKFWGFKDPRTILTYEMYEPFFEDDTYLVCVFRKPEKVVESLMARSRITSWRAGGLVKHYNYKMIDIIRKFTNQ